MIFGYLKLFNLNLLTLRIFICRDRCPKEMDRHIPSVMGLCLKYITFDPNYNYDNDEEEKMETEIGEDEEQGACS